MNAFRLGIVMLLLVTALGVVDLVVELPHLPEEVVTQFDFDGQPSGHGTRSGLSWGHAIAMAAVLLIMGGLPAVLPKLPLALLNVPHKDYWFAPERRRRSWAFVQAWMAWFGALTQGFMLAIFHGIHRFNRAGDPDATAVSWIPMAVYFAGMGIGLFLLFARFGKPPGNPGSDID